jgi:hypothetical protein
LVIALSCSIVAASTIFGSEIAVTQGSLKRADSAISSYLDLLLYLP